MGDEQPVRNFSDYLTVKGAAAFLGVSPSTLRNWDRSGKIKAVRNPLNGYRLYPREGLSALLKGMATGGGECLPNRR
jgi:MerR family transcriptional regulator, copper efflux regulator